METEYARGIILYMQVLGKQRQERHSHHLQEAPSGRKDSGSTGQWSLTGESVKGHENRDMTLVGRRSMGFGVLKGIANVVSFLLSHLGKFGFLIFRRCVSIFYLAGSLKALISCPCKARVVHAGLIQCPRHSWCSVSSSYILDT